MREIIGQPLEAVVTPLYEAVSSRPPKRSKTASAIGLEHWSGIRFGSKDYMSIKEALGFGHTRKFVTPLWAWAI